MRLAARRQALAEARACTTGRRARQASDATVNQLTRENEEVRDKERSADAEREMDKQDAETNNA